MSNRDLKHPTGWSKATVTSNFSLASLKITKNGITQPFLESLYATILIFECLSMVRRQKLCLSGLCLNSVFAPYCKDWETNIPPKHIRAPPISINTTQISPRHPQTSPRHPQTSPGNMPCQQTTTDAKGQMPDILKQHLSVSWGVWWCLLVSVGVCWYVVFLGDATGLSGGCLKDIWVVFVRTPASYIFSQSGHGKWIKTFFFCISANYSNAKSLKRYPGMPY